MTDELKTTERTELKRVPERGHFDRDVVNAIIDEAMICHVGIVDMRMDCLLYTSPSPRDQRGSRMPSSA